MANERNERYERNDETRGPSSYDRLLGLLDGLPDVVSVKPTTLRIVPPLGVGGAQTFVVQTYRQRDVGETIFLEHIADGGTIRLVIPPKVADAIARQRESLVAKSRSNAAKAVALDRKQRGILPGFMKKGGAR